MTVKRRGVAAVTGLLVAAFCALATFAVHGLFVGTELGQAVDQALLVRAAHLPLVVDRLAHALLSVFTLPLVVAAALVPPTLGLLRRSPWHALAAVVMVVGANVTTQVLKDHVFERPDLLALGAPNSLPSGHTTVAASVALAVALSAPPLLRLPVAVLGVAGSVLVGTATIVAGWHRLSDVAAAVLVSGAWAGLMLAVVVLRPLPARRPVPPQAADDGRIQPAARRTTATVHR
ncbi:MAG: phosphatase PAP2 family protein [Actinomycetota bacterium]|nr:phosphatase PAP2 family protein [Actinomycetota bacterium]